MSNTDLVFDHLGLHKDTAVGTLVKYTGLQTQQVYTCLHTLVKEGSIKKIERNGAPSLFKRTVKTRPTRKRKQKIKVTNGKAEPTTKTQAPDTVMAHAMKDAKREQIHSKLVDDTRTVSVEVKESEKEETKQPTVRELFTQLHATLDALEKAWACECGDRVEQAEYRALEAEEKQADAEKRLQEMKDLIASV